MSSPGHVVVDPVAHRAYVVSGGTNSLAVIDTTDHTVVGSVGGFSNPVGVAVDPSTHTVYVVNYNSEVVSVIDTTTTPATVTNTGYAGSRPWAVDVDPTTHKAYAATLFGGSVAVVSGTGITNRNDDTVSVIDLTDNSVVGSVPVGDVPQSVEVDPTTHRAYVMNVDSTISVIALLSSQEISFTSTPPAQPVVGTTYTATATGGASSSPVTFSTTSAPAPSPRRARSPSPMSVRAWSPPTKPATTATPRPDRGPDRDGRGRPAGHHLHVPAALPRLGGPELHRRGDRRSSHHEHEPVRRVQRHPQDTDGRQGRHDLRADRDGRRDHRVGGPVAPATRPASCGSTSPLRARSFAAPQASRSPAPSRPPTAVLPRSWSAESTSTGSGRWSG